MRSAYHPAEADRLAFLRRINILDTSREQIYDDFVLLAATICEAPIAAISLVDGDRQWFKSSIGLEVQQTSREVSFCSHAILQPGPLVVSDATRDSRFSDNELVSGEFHLRLYAGVPLTVEGYPLGSLCVIDRKPRELSQAQIAALEALARQLSICLEARLAGERQKELAERLQYTESILDCSRRRFEELFENMAVACYTTDTRGAIHEFNRQAEILFGYSGHEVLGAVDADVLLSEEAVEDAGRTRAQIVRGDSVRDRERRIRDRDGNLVWTLFSGQPVYGANGEITGTINVYHDIAARKQLEAQMSELNTALEQLASTDELTQIPNRRWITQYLSKEFDSRGLREVSVILIDIDHFKQYNDTYGHPAGDEVLKEVGRIIEGSCRQNDRAARYGGEEFIVVLPGTSAPDAERVAERIRASIEAHDGASRGVTASLGVATSDRSTRDVDQLVSLADVRLYCAKQHGRNRFVSGEQAAGSSEDAPEGAPAEGSEAA